jgi:2-keto-4-pentenoate hydratase/2-oxohepta-3-ene-1,7-dioic acid hydratase in catechol pathway
MKRLLLLLALAASAGAWLHAQAVTPFKLGTFQRGNQTFVGAVVADSVVDIVTANAALPGKRVAIPAEMKELIARYDGGVRERIGEIVRTYAALTGSRPSYSYALSAVRTLPPIMYPGVMLNAAVNYREHGLEMERAGASPQQQAAPGAPPPGTAPPGTRTMNGIWQRAPNDTRWNPYLFLKSPSAIIAEGEAIRIPRGRTQIDWECELGVVISKATRHVTAAQAGEHIFGYTMEMDVSDREARGDNRYGSDWLIAKNHDTFAPMGPFITPREFVPDPKNLPVKFTLNGAVMQDASTALMIHDVFELVSYGSNIMTLRAGDVIATGSPAGVGSARTPPVFLKEGDRTTCTYEGIGTLTNTVDGSR